MKKSGKFYPQRIRLYGIDFCSVWTSFYLEYLGNLQCRHSLIFRLPYKHTNYTLYLLHFCDHSKDSAAITKHHSKIHFPMVLASFRGLGQSLFRVYFCSSNGKLFQLDCNNSRIILAAIVTETTNRVFFLLDLEGRNSTSSDSLSSCNGTTGVRKFNTLTSLLPPDLYSPPLKNGLVTSCLAQAYECGRLV